MKLRIPIPRRRRSRTSAVKQRIHKLWRAASRSRLMDVLPGNASKRGTRLDGVAGKLRRL